MRVSDELTFYERDISDVVIDGIAIMRRSGPLSVVQSRPKWCTATSAATCQKQPSPVGKPEPRIMRYELTDYEWAAVRPFLPNKPRGVPRVNDRRVLNGIFWVLRSGAPWRDLPETFGPYLPT